jgi:DNA invertase Pin-like site-specific DNA recombinase
LTKKALAYVRVPSDEQTKGNGIPEQKANAESYCARNGLDLVDILIDDGYSASKGYHLSEGRLGSFRADAEKGKYKGFALVVSEMDRLSRQGITETRDLLTRFTKAGVEIHITQTNRVIRSGEDVVTEILNVLESHGAAEYSRKLSERIGKAWAAKKRMRPVKWSQATFLSGCESKTERSWRFRLKLRLYAKCFGWPL